MTQIKKITRKDILTAEYNGQLTKIVLMELNIGFLKTLDENEEIGRVPLGGFVSGVQATGPLIAGAKLKEMKEGLDNTKKKLEIIEKALDENS